ncbi:MAG: hypothetical protein ACJ790_04655 [Myxococcaceae bacterium]
MRAALLTLLIASSASATEISWRFEKFANEFWFIDQVSAWSEHQSDWYRKQLESKRKFDDATKTALKAYVTVREAHARDEEDSGQPDVTNPIRSMFPPLPRDEDRFTNAFLTATDEGAACDALKLKPDERAAVLNVFKLLRPDVDAIIADPYLEQARTKLAAYATESRMDEFLDRMKRFYGVKDDGAYRVHLLYAPEGFSQATVSDHEVIMPLTKSEVMDEKELPTWLGVVVHEFGHSYISQMPQAEVQAETNLIVNRGGLLNHTHSNIVDEATQTAIGNIVFVRDRMPTFMDRRSFYSFDPNGDYPDAIDSLARALEGEVSAALEKGGTFKGEFLEHALDIQARTFGNAPKLHTHVGLVLTGNKSALNRFNGLFWGRSRWSYSVDDPKGFQADSKKNPGIARFVIFTSEEATEEHLAAAQMPLATSFKLPKGQAGCAIAKRRSADGSYDFYVQGADIDGVRRVLIALHRAATVPESKPLCVK